MAKKGTMDDTGQSKGDLIWHPVRIRILVVVSGRRMTRQQIAATLPEVAQASLYRHIDILCDAGLLEASEDTTARGTVEKVYTLKENVADLTEADTAKMSYEELLGYFTNFVAMLMSNGRTYLQKKALDGRTGGVWETEALYLTDAEFEHYLTAMNAIQKLAKSNLPGSGRRRRLFFTAILPDED